MAFRTRRSSYRSRASAPVAEPARPPCASTSRPAPGGVLFGRYHLRILRTPREVRNALAYVLLNARKHFEQRWGVAPPMRLDEASSGRWFEGWRSEPAGPEARGDPRAGPREVARPRTWLLGMGWRRHGLIDPAEVPGR